MTADEIRTMEHARYGYQDTKAALFELRPVSEGKMNWTRLITWTLALLGCMGFWALMIVWGMPA